MPIVALHVSTDKPGKEPEAQHPLTPTKKPLKINLQVNKEKLKCLFRLLSEAVHFRCGIVQLVLSGLCVGLYNALQSLLEDVYSSFPSADSQHMAVHDCYFYLILSIVFRLRAFKVTLCNIQSHLI